MRFTRESAGAMTLGVGIPHAAVLVRVVFSQWFSVTTAATRGRAAGCSRAAHFYGTEADFLQRVLYDDLGYVHRWLRLGLKSNDGHSSCYWCRRRRW